MQLKVTLRGADLISSRFGRVGKHFKKRWLAYRIENIARLLEKQIIHEAPRRTGKLIRGIRAYKVEDLQWVIEDKEPHGVYVRRGARPHPIFPNIKRALYWSGLPHPVAYVKRHPGNKPNPYIKRAVDKAMPDIKREVDALGVDVEIAVET